MSSTNKTPNLELNSWIGSDIPKREDFNRDNSIIDSAVYDHTSDTDIHTTASDKAAWNQPFVITTYTGNGAVSREITVTDSFNPSFGFVFRGNYTPSVVDIANETQYNYFGIFGAIGSTMGLSLSGKKLTVQQASSSVLGNEMRCYNENGAAYVIVAFR